MPLQPAVNPGTIDWSGENPGILLKEDLEGPFSAMALFFRIAYSPVGQGEALLLFEKPAAAESLPAVRNVMISTREPLIPGSTLAEIETAPQSAAKRYSSGVYLPVKENAPDGF